MRSPLPSQTHFQAGPALTGNGSAPSWITKPSMMCVRICGFTMACGGFESPICLDTKARVGGGADGVGAKATRSLFGAFALKLATGSAFSEKQTYIKECVDDTTDLTKLSSTTRSSLVTHHEAHVPVSTYCSPSSAHSLGCLYIIC